VLRIAIIALLAVGCAGSSANQEYNDTWKAVEQTADNDDTTNQANAGKRVDSPAVLCSTVEVDDSDDTDKPDKPDEPKLKARVGAAPSLEQQAKQPVGPKNEELEKYDTNEDSYIDASERAMLFRHQAAEVFLRLDKNQDSRISVEEATHACGSQDARYVGPFRSRDIDRDGALSRFELETAVTKEGEKQSDRTWKLKDTTPSL
jgi:hypothetical protein